MSELNEMVALFRQGATWDALEKRFHHGSPVCKRMMTNAGVWQEGDETPYQRVQREAAEHLARVNIALSEVAYSSYQEKLAKAKAEALRLGKDETMSQAAIGKCVNVQQQTVGRWLREAGIRCETTRCPVQDLRDVQVIGGGHICPTVFCARHCDDPRCEDMNKADRDVLMAEYQIWLAKAIARREATMAETRRIHRRAHNPGGDARSG